MRGTIDRGRDVGEPAGRRLNVFFDVDNTIITWDVKLRPGVREVFSALREEGHTVYLWSGMGPRWEVVRRFSLHEHVADCFWKPLTDHHNRLRELGIPVWPDFVIDDHREVVEAFAGVQVPEPLLPLEHDREMWRVLEEIRRFARGAYGR